MACGVYRRLGISPDPEVFVVVMIALFLGIVNAYAIAFIDDDIYHTYSWCIRNYKKHKVLSQLCETFKYRRKTGEYNEIVI